MRRTWIKLFCDNWLRGSIRQESLEVRAIFADLLALAGDSAFGDSGLIKLASGIGIADATIAGILNIPPEVWLAAKERLSNHPDPKENRIELLPLSQGYAIKIINWRRYQSEYQRQKAYQDIYRKRKKTARQKTPSSPPSSPKKNEEEEEGEGEGEQIPRQLSPNLSPNLSPPLIGSLPPIPKNATFETIRELEDLRRQIFDEEKSPNSGRLQTLRNRYLKLVGIYAP
jgi:hypothetical protein